MPYACITKMLYPSCCNFYFNSFIFMRLAGKYLYKVDTPIPKIIANCCRGWPFSNSRLICSCSCLLIARGALPVVLALWRQPVRQGFARQLILAPSRPVLTLHEKRIAPSRYWYQYYRLKNGSELHVHVIQILTPPGFHAAAQSV